jgi:hypothetical protein
MANSVSGSDGVFQSGLKNVASAGTAEALGTGLYNSVVIIATPSNTGQIYVGGSDVASTTNDGLDSGDVLEIAPTKAHGINLAKIFLDASVSTDGVSFYAVV